MGWTYSHRQKGISTIEWFRERFGDGRDGGPGVLDATAVGGFQGTAYLAYRPAEGMDVLGVIVLYRWSRDHFNFGYKAMNETEGPYECECPKRIYNQLDPLDPESAGYEHARGWREKVEAHHEKLAGRPRMTVGALATWTAGIPDLWPQTLVCTNARRLLFQNPEYPHGGGYRLRRWCLDTENVSRVEYPNGKLWTREGGYGRPQEEV